MDLSVVTNIILCVLSFILAAISVITVVITLRQNHKMIENSTRPYLTVYHNCTYFDTVQHYLILKNFGVSSANIIEFTSDCDMSILAFLKGRIPFDSLDGVTLVPGQKILYALDGKNFSKQECITFTLKYQSDKRHLYCETIQIRPEYLNDISRLRASTENKEMRTISYSLQDIAEKML